MGSPGLKDLGGAVLVAVVVATMLFVEDPKPAGTRTESNPAGDRNSSVHHPIAARDLGERPSRLSEPGSLPGTAKGEAAWACQFGKEFWRGKDKLAFGPQIGKGLASLPSAAWSMDVIERVSHAFQVEASGAGHVESAAYRAKADARTLTFVPRGLNGVSDSEVEAQFQTRLVQRGDHCFFSNGASSPDSLVIGNTWQTSLDADSGLVEHFEARKTGVEVTWLLQRPLPGSGDLIIESELAGLQSSIQTASGVHFMDRGGIPRVKVGAVIAADSAGHIWPLTLQLANGALQVRVPGTVLIAASFPLAIDPLISAEFGVDRPVDGPTPCTRAAPAVAANDSGFLVVWTHGKGETTDLGVYAARIDFAGNLLDPNGILISTLAGEQSICAVAGNKDSFLVAWSAPHGNSISDWDILGARVAANGTLLDAAALPICAMVSTIQNSPAVAANGDDYLVVWRDSRFTGIYGNIVGQDGTLSFTNGFPICTAANDQYTPAVASLGTNYLVVWQDYRKATSTLYYSDIYGARITGAGLLIDTNGIPICTRTNSQYHPAIAANGTNYLVVWEDYDIGGNDIFGARVSPDGTVLDPDGLVLTHGANLQANPAVAGIAGDFLVAWQDFRNSPTNNFEANTYCTRVHSDGSIDDLNGTNLSARPGGQTLPAVAATGTNGLVVWQDFRSNPSTTFSDIYGVKVNAAGTLGTLPDAKISGSANAELSPAVAANGTNFLVVWSDNRNAAASGRDIYGARLDSDGAFLDPAAFVICSATNNQTDPVVAANGSSYLVVWSDKRNASDNLGSSDVYGTTVAFDGTVLQPGGIPMCTATNDQLYPAVALLDTNFVVVWQDARNSVSTAVRWDIYGTRVTSDGVVLDPAGIPVCTYLPDQITPAIAANPGQALVVWIDSRGAAGASHVYGTRLSLDGTVADTNGFPICTAGGQQLAPAVAADGEGYFVVWADSRNGATSPFDIYGALVDASAVVSPTNGFPIRLGRAAQAAPSLSFNGSDYLLTWQEGHGSSTNYFDILGAIVAVDGTVASGSPFVINSNSPNQLFPVSAAEADGRFLVLNQASEASSTRAIGNLVNAAHLEFGGSFTNGQFQFRLVAATGQRYAIEASDDLKTWSQIGSLLSTNMSTWFIDAASTNKSSRFYRAVLLP